DSTDVYWTSDRSSSDDTDPGMIARCPKTGCNGVGIRVSQRNLDYPEGVAVDDTYAYFSENYMWTVGRTTKSGDGGAFSYLVTQMSNVQTVLVDDASVYFSGNDQSGDNIVGRISKSAATGIADASAEVGQNFEHVAPVGVYSPYALALDDQTI